MFLFGFLFFKKTQKDELPIVLSMPPVVGTTTFLKQSTTSFEIATKTTSTIVFSTSSTSSLETKIFNDGLKKLTKEEVAKHNLLDDCYVIIENYVYNLSKWMLENQKNQEFAFEFCGKDITDKFKEIFKDENEQKRILENFKIGIIKED